MAAINTKNIGPHAATPTLHENAVIEKDLTVKGKSDIQGPQTMTDPWTFSADVTMNGSINTIAGDLTHTGSKVGLYGVTAVVKAAPIGVLAGFVAGSGAPALNDSTFTGATGSSAYTTGEIVKALKDVGILTV